MLLLVPRTSLLLEQCQSFAISNVGMSIRKHASHSKKTIGAVEAELKAPPVYQNWKQWNPKVIKEMTKFANGGYAGHIVSSTQKTELQENLAAIPSTPMDVPNDKRFKCASL
jgi:hypothetical protein